MIRVEVRNVSKRYGKIIALDRVSVTIEKGEYVCVIGPSGSGKSTLLKIIAGIVKPDEGEVLFNGRVVNEVPLEERGIGMVMQDILLFPHMTVHDNVIYSVLVKHGSYSLAEKVGKEVLTDFDILLWSDKYPDELSRGMQQKVAIARAVVSGAKLLLMDEPLGSVDPRAAKQLRYELRELVKDLGLTAIHVTHNQEEAMSIADKIIVLRRGRIEQVGTPLELYLQPKTLFVARFIGGEVNFIKGYVKNGRVETDVGVFNPVRRFKDGEKVVVVLRPEHVKISRSRVEGASKGKIVKRNFLGPLFRYEVEVNGAKIISKVPRNLGVFRVGEEIYVKFERVGVFKYPRVGLKEAIVYE